MTHIIFPICIFVTFILTVLYSIWFSAGFSGGKGGGPAMIPRGHRLRKLWNFTTWVPCSILILFVLIWFGVLDK